MVLLPGQSRLRERLLAAEEPNRQELAKLHGAHHQAVAHKRHRYERVRGGGGVVHPEKRFF